MVSVRPTPFRALLPHLVWEAALLVAAAGALLAVLRGRTGADAAALWAHLGILGLLASAFAFSLRIGTPNLAVGPIAAAAGVAYVALVNAQVPSLVAALAGTVGALAVGLVLGLIVGLTPAPAWAVSLAALGVLQSLALLATDGQVAAVEGAALDPAVYPTLAVGFVVISVAGALWWLVSGARDALGPVPGGPVPGGPVPGGPVPGGPGPNGGRRRLRGALAGLAGSSGLAALSGVLMAAYLGAAQPVDTRLTWLAVAAAVLGGASVQGRYAGVAGTVLAVTLAASLDRLLAEEQSYRGLSADLLWGGMLMLGLLAGGVLARFGRRFDSAPTAGGPTAGGPTATRRTAGGVASGDGTLGDGTKWGAGR